MLCAVLVLEELEPRCRLFYEVCQAVVNVLYLGFDARHEFVGFLFVELQYALHLYLQQPEYVVLGYLAHQGGVVGCQTVVDVFAYFVDVGSFLELLVLIDALLDEYFLQRLEVQLLQQFVAAYLQFLTYEVLGALGVVDEHVADGEELRFLVLDDAAVWRDVYLAVGEGIECVDGLVARYAGHEVDQYLHLCRCEVVDVSRLYLAFFNGFLDALYETFHGLREWQVANDERLLVNLLDLGTHLEHTAALAVVIFRHVDESSGLEVGVQVELLSVQIADGGVAELAEVVGQDLRRQTHGNALGALRQQQWELHWQCDGLLVAAVVAELPLRGLGVEHGVERKFRQSCLDVSGRCGAVAGQYVAPVALCVNEQVLLSQLHQRVAYGGVAVGVELHGVAHNVGHLVVSAVVHAFHGVQYAPLHGFQSVLDVWHGALQYHV